MATECEMPKYCKKRDMSIYYNEGNKYYVTCSIKGSSQLKFDINKNNENIDRNGCNKTGIGYIKIKPGLFESNVKLGGKSIDVKSFVQYISTIKSRFILEFDSFQGFDLQFFQNSKINRTLNFDYLISLACNECLLKFYIGEKQMKSCQDFHDSANNFSAPSIQYLIFITFFKRKINTI